MNDAVGMNDTIVCEIDIAASPERVFQAWIDPQQRLAWWGDDATYRGTKLESDLRVGGKWRTEGRGKEGKPYTVSGEYTRVEPPRALGFTWNHNWGGQVMPQTHVLVELTPTSSGTPGMATRARLAAGLFAGTLNRGLRHAPATRRRDPSTS